MVDELKKQAEEQDVLTETKTGQGLKTSTKVILTTVVLAAVAAGVFAAIAMSQ